MPAQPTMIRHGELFKILHITAPTEFYTLARRHYGFYSSLWHEISSDSEFLETQSVNPYHSFNSESYFHHLSKHQTTDLIIEVGESPNTEKFRAHTEILSNSTPYFECALSSSWAIFENDEIIFKKPNITPQVFHIVLDGIVHWKKHTEKDILNFLVAADELLIDRILDEGQRHLIEQRYEWILYNLNFTTFISFKYKSFEKLRNYCIVKICENPRLTFSSNYFLKFDEGFWIKFLNQDNIQMEEFEIWHNLILWGIEQFSITKNQSFFNFSKNELIHLKSILQHCIPLIRFTEFSVNQLYTYVWPFRDIIDLKLRKEINETNFITKYLYTEDCFIFSFGTLKNPQNVKFSFAKKKKPAIRDDPNLGPCFGRKDICITNNFKTHGTCSSESSSFNDIIFAKNFTIIEYEVFQVVYKRSEENRWVSFMNSKYFENDKKYPDNERISNQHETWRKYIVKTAAKIIISTILNSSSDANKIEPKKRTNEELINKVKEYKIIINERDQVEQENRSKKIEYLVLNSQEDLDDEAL
ncbi:2716_t:CDS:2 [Dentiscutata erythropus]|uniref:2716_t:CDS:1 n=1 Tax=Dentiscutata erythropus TaxID=1348616 RepID=A0A9N9BRZ5_9GLOM|nr:2716_t:CDS:2 [Dentiscutata erythropus]